MKAKVIIENGETTIVLTPENVFETDVIEKVKQESQKFNSSVYFDAQYSYGTYSKHNIQINLKEIR